MASETHWSRNPAGHAGLLENLLALLSALAEFFESRFALAAQESKAAAVQLLILVGCMVAALALCVLGYIFLVVAAVAGLAHLMGTSWAVIVLAAAILHFVVALALVLVARSRITKPVFRATRIELRKDREWLKNLDATNRSMS
jgi:uncharacterized membrane protein YqjE